MDYKRAATPPPSQDAEDLVILSPPATPSTTSDVLPRTTIPPSPDGPRLTALAASLRRPAQSRHLEKLQAPPLGSKRSHTVGVRKLLAKDSKTKGNTAKIVKTLNDGKKKTEFMDLPGEIRNIIYSFASQSPRQALLVHRPRLASLRPRTQLDRQRTLASDIIEKEQDRALPAASRRGGNGTSKRKPKTALLARETNRPFFGFTQVCRLIRREFRPWYMQRQEVGMDLTEVVKYLQAFYHDAPALLEDLSTSNDRKIDMPFTGNLTIAVGDKAKEVEKSADGVDVWPLLDLWANSYKIEAGFGRYMQVHYDARADGEAKDLYRLFGRRVQFDRRCSNMNTKWRAVLRTRSLAAICIHRQPSTFSQSPSPTTQHPPNQSVAVVSGPRPYIHITFRRGMAEAWMTEEASTIPAEWLANHGFDNMDYFEVKVGVAPV